MKPAIQYTIDASNTHAHLFRVSLHIENPQAGQVVSLPVWIPGSYLIREFSKNLQNLKAQQGGKSIAVVQDNKCEWHTNAKAAQSVHLTYEV